MNARISFLKRLAFGLAAVGIAVAASGTAMAQKSWNGGSGTWSTAANWTPSGQPGPGGTATINGTSGKTITISTSTAQLSGVSVTTDTTFDGTGTLKFRDAATLAIGSTTTNFNNAGGIELGATPPGTNGSLSVTGTGTLNLTGPITADFGVVGTLTLGSGLTTIGGPAFGSAVDITNQGTLKLTGAGSFTGTNLNTTGATLSGSGTGTYFAPTAANQFNSINLFNSTVETYFNSNGSQFDNFQTTNAVALNGTTLNLNFGNLTGATLGSQWKIFNGDSTANFAGVTATGTVNGQTVSFTNDGGPNGGTWASGSINPPGSQYLQFRNDGTLIVVPEPSTIVFAGVGVAMAGWSAWKKRRLAKVLAKN